MSEYIYHVIRSIKDKQLEFTQQNRQQVYDLLNHLVLYSGGIVVPTASNSIKIVELSEILYVEEPKKGMVFIHTKSDTIEYTNKACNLLEFIERIDDKFKYLNKGLVVNIEKVKGYNSFLRKVYFENNKVAHTTGVAVNSIIVKLVGKEKDEFTRNIDLKYGIYEY